MEEGLRELLRFDNVIGYTISKIKYKKGVAYYLEKPTIIVFVKKKLPKELVPKEELIPPVIKIGDVEYITDVVEILQPSAIPLTQTRPAHQTARHRPIPSGVSGAAKTSSACTVGAFAVGPGGERYIITCSHCLARIEFSCETGAAVGNRYLQPSPFDGGTDSDAVGIVSWAYDLMRPDVEMDLGLVMLNPEVEVSPKIFGAEIPITGVRELTFDDIGRTILVKSGRTTGITYARPLGLGTSVKVYYGACGTALVSNAILTEKFIERGDSGSAVVTLGGDLIGIAFATTDKFSFVMPIAKFLPRFNLQPLLYRQSGPWGFQLRA